MQDVYDSNYFQQHTLDDESADDLYEMIRLLAEARAKARSREAVAADLIFSGGALCTFFEPLKTPDYTYQAHEFRRAYKGIAHDVSMQERYRASFNPELLGIESIVDLISYGFEGLFSGGRETQMMR